MSLFVTAIAVLAVAKAEAKVEYPKALQADIEYSREMCRAVGEYFEFSPRYVLTEDFNQDAVPDYMLDTNGIKCGKSTERLFGGAQGQPLYLYMSQATGDWEKIFSAYVFEYRVKKIYGELPYFDVWVRGELGYQVNFQRYQWSGEKFEVVEQEAGVDVPEQLWKNFD